MAKSAFDLIEDDLLVEEVSKNHVLYDSSHEKHKDLHFKDTVWNRIAPVVGRNSEYLPYTYEFTRRVGKNLPVFI